MSIIAIYKEPNQPVIEDHETFVNLVGVGRFMVAVATIFDDGEVAPGPLNYEVICPNFESAHAYVQQVLNNEHVRAERINPDEVQSNYALYFNGETKSEMFVFLELMRLVDGDFNAT